MKAFDYVAPATLSEAMALLASPGARPLAGGTDLLVQMKEGRRHYELLVDLKGVPELSRLEFDREHGLRVGAAITCTAIEEHPAVRAHYPALAAACAMIGSHQIQNRASLGGNLCNAAPSADGVPALIVLGGEAVIAGPQGTRRLPAEQVPAGPGRTSLAAGEMLIEIRVPVPPARSGASYLRFVPREEMDIAVAGSGVWVQLDPSGKTFTAARICLSAVAPVPLRVPEAEAALVGQPAVAAVVDRAAAVAAAAAKPISDVRGSAEYRRHLVDVLTRRAALAALEAARNREGV